MKNGRIIPFKFTKGIAAYDPHRHYSHLIGIYPLYHHNWENPTERPMIERSVRRWFDTDKGGRLAGYSFTGFALMLAAMGKGDEAADVLGHFVDGIKGRCILGANTLYFEAGGQAPVIETPLSAAQNVHELLLQSWGGKIRIFPAVPSTWKDVAFHERRTEGAFLVSAAKQNGVTRFVRVKSLMGELCRIQVGAAEKMEALSNTVKLTTTVTGVITLGLQKEEKAILVPVGKQVLPLIALVEASGKRNPFGLKS